MNEPDKIRGYRLWRLVLIANLCIIGGWWWLSPKGFPLSHSRFWVNSALPWLGFFILVGSSRALVRVPFSADGLLATIPGFWLGMTITVGVLFQSSSLKLFVIFIPISLGLSILGWLSLRKTRQATLFLLTSLILGGFVALSQRAPLPSTQPSGGVLALPSISKLNSPTVYRRGPVLFDPRRGEVSVSLGKLTVEIKPLLQFYSRSPDRCWTNLAPIINRQEAEKKFLGVQQIGTELQTFYQSDFRSRLGVIFDETSVTLNTTSHLPKPIYSHLNSYCDLSIYTQEKVQILFSPCPKTPIEITESDYPVGRPARMAYLTNDGFHIVEADSGEKGPFTKLASGPLRRGEPITLTFIVGDKAICSLELLDWSHGASFDLSPTAGWGLPMNAIEFNRSRFACSVWIALAATSVGHGWDSVGHAAGTYRGRMKLLWF